MHCFLLSAMLCDIDQVVVEQSRAHLPHLASAAAGEPARARVVVGDGAHFLDDKASFLLRPALTRSLLISWIHEFGSL